MTINWPIRPPTPEEMAAIREKIATEGVSPNGKRLSSKKLKQARELRRELAREDRLESFGKRLDAAGIELLLWSYERVFELETQVRDLTRELGGRLTHIEEFNLSRGRYLGLAKKIPPILYEKLFEKQGGVCAICKQPETSTNRGRVKRLSVDHCHTTRKIRGLLCQLCNTGLGSFRDSSEWLVAASEYLGTVDDRIGDLFGYGNPVAG